MFLTKLKLASVVVLVMGAVAAAGVLAQQRGGPAGNPGDNTQRGYFYRSGLPQAVEWISAPVPEYITQSRAMIISRLEAEAAEARARLDRTIRKVRSPEDPAVVLARKTFEDLQQRLDRIDRVLVDVVEAYPTLFDFSVGSSELASSKQPATNANGQTNESEDRFGGQSPDEADQSRAVDRVIWATRMYLKGYVSKAQLDSELANSKRMNVRSEDKQPQNGAQSGSKESKNSRPDQGKGNRSSDMQNSGEGKKTNSQEGNDKDKQNAGAGQQNKPQPSQESDGGNSSKAQQGNPQQNHSPVQGNTQPEQQRQDKSNG